jgi:hypothetical protein
VGAGLRPLHRLLFGDAPTDHEVDGGFHEGGGNPFAVVPGGTFLPDGIRWVVERSFAWISRYRRLNTISKLTAERGDRFGLFQVSLRGRSDKHARGRPFGSAPQRPHRRRGRSSTRSCGRGCRNQLCFHSVFRTRAGPTRPTLPTTPRRGRRRGSRPPGGPRGP